MRQPETTWDNLKQLDATGEKFASSADTLETTAAEQKGGLVLDLQ